MFMFMFMMLLLNSTFKKITIFHQIAQMLELNIEGRCYLHYKERANLYINYVFYTNLYIMSFIFYISSKKMKNLTLMQFLSIVVIFTIGG